MRSIAIVDTSALYAAADSTEPAHRHCLEVLGRRELDLVIPVLAVAEATYLVASRLGGTVEVAFLRGLSAFAIEPPTVDDWPHIADLVERYADLGLGATDASIAVLADRLGTDLVITLDRRHFGTIRLPDGRPFRILPDSAAVHESPGGYRAVGGGP
jgi:predicted nucleic acid-binding protein